MFSRSLLSITLSVLLLTFGITTSMHTADGHGGAGAPGHKKIRNTICSDRPCVVGTLEKDEEKFCFLFWCFNI